MNWKAVAKRHFKSSARCRALAETLRIAEAALFELSKGDNLGAKIALDKVQPLAMALNPGLDWSERTRAETLHMEPGKLWMTIRAPHWAMEAVAASLAESMKGAPNYMTAEATIPGEDGKFEVVLRRIGQGKTAHALREEAEKKLLAVVKAIEFAESDGWHGTAIGHLKAIAGVGDAT